MTHRAARFNSQKYVLIFIWQKAMSMLWLWMKLELVPQDLFFRESISLKSKPVVLELFTQSGMISLWSFPPSLAEACFHRGRRDVMFEEWSLLGGVVFEECALMRWWQDVCMMCALGWRWFCLLIDSSLLQSFWPREPNMDIVLLLLIRGLKETTAESDALLNEQQSLVSLAKRHTQSIEKVVWDIWLH